MGRKACLLEMETDRRDRHCLPQSSNRQKQGRNKEVASPGGMCRGHSPSGKRFLKPEKQESQDPREIEEEVTKNRISPRKEKILCLN